MKISNEFGLPRRLFCGIDLPFGSFLRHRHNIFINHINTTMEESNNNNKGRNNIPDYDPSKAMDSRKEVDQSNDEKIDQDLPGYPHYPAKEDIMNQKTESHRMDLDVENIPSSQNDSGVNERFLKEQKRPGEKSSNNEDSGSNQEVSKRLIKESEELSNLNSRNNEIGKPHNVSNEDLDNKDDLPGSHSEKDNV